MDTLRDWWDRKMRDPITLPVVIFGQEIKTEEELRDKLRELTLFTYRENFTALPLSSTTSDKGWGCLIRTSQMLLARTMAKHGTFRMEHFYDVDHDDIAHPFSIHNFVRSVQEGSAAFKAEYWSPTQGCTALRNVVNLATTGMSPPVSKPLGVYVSKGATVYNDQVEFCLREKGSLLLLVSVRAGVQRRLSQTTFMSIERLMRHHTSVGIVGGVPNRSYYIIGTATNRFVYLDPHVLTQPAMRNEDSQLKSFEIPQTLPWTNWDRVDTSLLFGFYISEPEDFSSLTNEINAIDDDGMERLVYIAANEKAEATERPVDDLEGWSTGSEDD